MGGTEFPKTSCSRSGAYTIHRLDDGTDYWAILQDFEAGLIPYAAEYGEERRKTYIVDVDDRRFVIKYDSRPIEHLDSRIVRALRGPVFRTLMLRANDAIRRGCDIIPRIFLVAEKMAGSVAAESVMIVEYVVGLPLDAGECVRRRDEIRRVLEKLHSYKLAHLDIHRGNFIVTEHGLKLIDLSFKDGFALGRAKDVLRARHRLDIQLSCRSLLEKAMMAYLLSSLFLQNINRRLRGRRIKQYY